MKWSIWILFSLLSTLTAGAQECTLKLSARFGGSAAAQARRTTRLEKLLNRKGYQVTDSSEAAWRLSVHGAQAMCAMGLRFKDEVFAFPASYGVTLSRGDQKFGEGQNYHDFILGIDARAGKYAIEAAGSLPDCHACRVLNHDGAQGRPLSASVRRILARKGYTIVEHAEEANYDAGESCTSEGNDDYCSLQVRKRGSKNWTEGEHREGRASLVDGLAQELRRAHDYRQIRTSEELELESL